MKLQYCQRHLQAAVLALLLCVGQGRAVVDSLNMLNRILEGRSTEAHVSVAPTTEQAKIVLGDDLGDSVGTPLTVSVISVQVEQGNDSLSVDGCTAACRKEVLGTWPWEKAFHCHTEDKCAMCQEFCVLLQNKDNINSLCNREECSSGCQAACNYVRGIALSGSLSRTYIGSVFVMALCGSSMLGLAAYLIYIICNRNKSSNFSRYEDALMWQELHMLDTPVLGRATDKMNPLSVHHPLAQSLLSLLKDGKNTEVPCQNDETKPGLPVNSCVETISSIPAYISITDITEISETENIKVQSPDGAYISAAVFI